ncbi:MAG: hypothetical protein IT382_08390 [Deltaproteobacteria bacterium]|nr:hypothetical protein [Deltaproteobacteria bacterium]
MVVLPLLLLIAVAPDAPAPGTPAPENSVVPEVRDRVEAPPHTWLALRGGLASGGAAPVQVCATAMPAPVELGELRSAFGVEACGNGSGFLHHESAPEIAHFRGRFRITSVETGFGFVEPTLSAGFAELQLGPDAPGFSFAGAGPGGMDTAGPEVGAALGWALPLGLGLEAVAELTLNLAYFAYAPQLVDPQDPFQPSVAVSAGIGW